jgi:nitroimidazol reductase NimA-like FMN-containing flavoprotein (pyridoxamine 5'-phosphate oxidase superfamily)
MRRKDREIQNIDKIIDIIKRCKICRLGLCDNNQPYIVPLNYGLSCQDSKLTLYFHSATEGKKTDIIKRNNKACFEIDCDTKLMESETPCRCGYQYTSIIGFGEIFIVESSEEKKEGLNLLMQHQTGKIIEYAFKRIRKISCILHFARQYATSDNGCYVN